MTRKQRNILNFLALLFLLIILPVAALYFLDLGVDYRKELLAELDDHGQVPEFSLVSVTGDTVTENTLKNHIVLANFMDITQEYSDLKASKLKKFNEQFGDREEVLFLNFIRESESDSITITGVNTFLKSKGLEDCERCYFVFDVDATLDNLAEEGFGFPLDNGMTIRNNPLIALCDKTGTIKRYYNLENETDNTLLVRHIIMFLPAGEGREGDFEIFE